MTQTEHNAPLREMAGEYVLGTMQGEAREQFEQLLTADVGLQAEVSVWEEKLSSMLDLIEPVAPPAALWQQIQQQIEPSSKLEQKSSFWESLGFWRNLSIVAATMVFALGLTLFGVNNGPAMDQVLMVTSDNRVQVQWVVGISGQADKLQVRAVAPPKLEPGQVCQLWMENSDGTLKPVGVLPHTGSQSMAIPTILKADSRFKVSIEQADNLPSKKPSTKFVFEGGLTKI